MPEKTWRNLGLVVRRVLRQPFAITVFGAGVLLSIMIPHGLPIALAIAAILVYTGSKLRDDEFIREAIDEDRDRRLRIERRNRTFRIEELDVDSRVRMKSIVKLQGEIAEEIVNSPVDEIAIGLADTVERTEQVVDRGLSMALKRRDLQRYLAKTDLSAIEARIRSLETKLAGSAGTPGSSEIEAALAAKRQELEDYNAIRQASQRVLDELDSIECSFQGLRTRLVRVASTNIDDWVVARDDLNAELTGVTTAVETVAQSVEEALTVRGFQ